MSHSSNGEMVMCARHKKPRMRKFCHEVNIYNAAMEVVGTKVECLPTQQCHVGEAVADAAAAASSSLAVGSSGGGVLTATGNLTFDVDRVKFASASDEGATSGGVDRADANSGPAPSAGGGASAKGRYYDLSRQEGRERVIGKTCFSCGQDDHERSTCPNQFCRGCHAPRPNNMRHVCAAVELSPFVMHVPPTADETRFSRCIACHELGHIDCRSTAVRAAASESCAWCGSRGHHAFNCPNAPTDPWMDNVLFVASGRAQGHGGSSHPGRGNSQGYAHDRAFQSHNSTGTDAGFGDGRWRGGASGSASGIHHHHHHHHHHRAGGGGRGYGRGSGGGDGGGGGGHGHGGSGSGRWARDEFDEFGDSDYRAFRQAQRNDELQARAVRNSRECYNCGSFDHIAKHCPQARSARGSDRANGGSNYQSHYARRY